jgi:hypothetical protein
LLCLQLHIIALLLQLLDLTLLILVAFVSPRLLDVSLLERKEELAEAGDLNEELEVVAKTFCIFFGVVSVFPAIL